MIIVQNLYLRKRKFIKDKENTNIIAILCLKTKIYVTFQKETHSVERQKFAGSKPASGISRDPHTSQFTVCCKQMAKEKKRMEKNFQKENLHLIITI